MRKYLLIIIITIMALMPYKVYAKFDCTRYYITKNGRYIAWASNPFSYYPKCDTYSKNESERCYKENKGKYYLYDAK